MNEADVSDMLAYVRSQRLKRMQEIDAHYRAVLRALQPIDNYVGGVAELLKARMESLGGCSSQTCSSAEGP